MATDFIRNIRSKRGKRKRENPIQRGRRLEYDETLNCVIALLWIGKYNNIPFLLRSLFPILYLECSKLLKKMLKTFKIKCREERRKLHVIQDCSAGFVGNSYEKCDYGKGSHSPAVRMEKRRGILFVCEHALSIQHSRSVPLFLCLSTTLFYYSRFLKGLCLYWNFGISISFDCRTQNIDSQYSISWR